MRLETVRNPLVLGFCGSMGAGKSTLASQLKEQWEQADIISFGNFVRYQAAFLQLEPRRENLQNLGQQLYNEHGPQILVDMALQWSQPKTHVHIFDGIRHLSVWQAIGQLYEKPLLISLQLDLQSQRQRLQMRAPLEADRILEARQHIVESEHEVLHRHADLQLDASLPIDQLILSIETLVADLQQH